MTIFRAILGLKMQVAGKQFRRVNCNTLNLQLDGTSDGHIKSGKPKWTRTRHEPDL
jgi:hypothetical protein